MKNRYILDTDAYAKMARLAAAEGAVLIKNKDQVLPLKENTQVCVFGRTQLNYYKSGTGSGGMVNTKYTVGILEALEKPENLKINQKLKEVYKSWETEHPFDSGEGWAMEPWCQEEMPLDDKLISELKKETDTAVIIIGRTAGEDKDNSNTKGSLLLTDLEEEMLSKVSKAFSKTVLLLNVGNIIDMSFLDRYDISSVLYVWQGGMEGGNAVADLLLGRVSPSGHLTDTISLSPEDNSVLKNFGAETENFYEEDIYVGYRYFETFAKETVRYPFGYGLSYTSFEISDEKISYKNNALKARLVVKNTGEYKGKEVIQFYIKAPQGKLGKPKRTLIGFQKTKELAPGASETIEVDVRDMTYASFDDSGVTGFKNYFVCEAGEYVVYAGNNVREAKEIGRFKLERDTPVINCNEIEPPAKAYKRIKPKSIGGNNYVVSYEDVPINNNKRARKVEETSEYEYTGDLGYRLEDVYDRKISLGSFISQLTDEDLRCLVRGEGMSSKRVTPGTAAAFGGVSDRLESFGIPAGCCSDGPSGIRMDCGTSAFLLPNGTCLACSFNEDLNEKLYEFLGCELRKNRIDLLLGPGMNIHRSPLNGRNFEYFSEDPLITGKIAAAQLRGLNQYGVSGTIKHFACNNQEHNRRNFNSIVSQRAMREIYLKGFEIAIKEGKAYSVMTTYGAVNGQWTAGSVDLVKTLLRKEWGFEGIVMTDWWADVNDYGEEKSTKNLAAMVKAENDLYMVTKDALENEKQDNLKPAFEQGKISRGMLEKSAVNILKVVMRSPAMERYLDRISEEEKEAQNKLDEEDMQAFNLTYSPMKEVLDIDTSVINTERGKSWLIGIEAGYTGSYEIELTYSIKASDLAQVPLTIYANGIMFGTVVLKNTDGKASVITKDIGFFGNKYNTVKLYFGLGGIKLQGAKIRMKEKINF